MLTPEQSPLLQVREETISMSKLSLFGLEIALAKWRNTNPHLYRYVEGLHHLLPDTTASFYNTILLEYELQRKAIPLVEKKTIEGYTPPEEFDLRALEIEQPYLVLQVRNYLDQIRNSGEKSLANAAQASIQIMYELLRVQAGIERSQS